VEHGLASRLEGILRRIEASAIGVSRNPSAVTLVAVSKLKSTDLMREYLAAARCLGVRVVFGENYVQELTQKVAELGSVAEFHLIGALQSNKVKQAVRVADVIESVHSVKVLELVAKEAQAIGKRQAVYIQVNIGVDPAKSGFLADDVLSAIDLAAKRSESLSVLGLMTITPYYGEGQDEIVRRDFVALRGLRDSLVANGVARFFEGERIALSMGMSSDFEVAIEEGADLVRIGSAIFGER
jgi:pyridoxal phosphate enzyme (YggS family)